MSLQHEIEPLHLRPSAELAERVLLPDDPHRALAVAQHLLEGPRMFNHTRGLWGYTGVAADGEPLTIQSTGMGGPSAAIVTEELIALGARRLVRIGTCTALTEDLELGALVAAETVAADGSELAPERGLLAGLVGAGARPGRVASTDLFYDRRDEHLRDWAAAGARVVEMEAAAILRVAERRGAEAACVLAVTATPAARLQGEELEQVTGPLADAGFAALANRPTFRGGPGA